MTWRDCGQPRSDRDHCYNHFNNQNPVVECDSEVSYHHVGRLLKGDVSARSLQSF